MAHAVDHLYHTIKSRNIHWYLHHHLVIWVHNICQLKVRFRVKYGTTSPSFLLYRWHVEVLVSFKS